MSQKVRDIIFVIKTPKGTWRLSASRYRLAGRRQGSEEKF